MGKITLEGGEEVLVEGGSMVSMSDGIKLETGATGGLWRSLGRSLFGGETFFQNTCQVPPGGGPAGRPARPGPEARQHDGPVRLLRSLGSRARETFTL